MTLFRTPIFACMALFTALFMAPAFTPSAHAQGYSGGGSTFIDFGDLGGFNNGASGTTEVFDIGFNASGGADLLGCAGVSLEGFMDAFANLEHVFDNFLDNIKQAFFRRLLVEAFSRLPQIGALFDTVNALGNARFEMFNESCDIDSIRADAQTLIEQRCRENGGSDLECNKATADAGEYTEQANEISEELTAFHERMTDISNALAGPLCKTNVAEANTTCGLMSFLPQMQLCWNIGGKNVGGGKPIGDCAQSRTTSAQIGSGQVFNSSFDLASNITTGLGNATRGLANQLGQDNINLQKNLFLRDLDRRNAAAAAEGGPQVLPSVASNTRAGQTRIALIDFDFDIDIAQFAQDSAESGQNNDIEEFKKFLHCSESDPTKVMAEFIDYLGANGVSADDIPEISIDEIKASEVLNFSEGEVTAIETVAIGNATQALALVTTAVGCVMNHQLHIGLDTYVAMQRLPAADQRAFQLAAANRVAYLTTEIILRFLKQKTLNAHAQLASGVTPSNQLQSALSATQGETVGEIEGSKDFKTPEPVLIAVRTIADMFENQIQALRSVRQERDSFAAMSAIVYEKIEENKARAQGR